MNDNKAMCFRCRKLNGFEGRDQGAHTAQRKECECCGNIEGILPSRHWVKCKPSNQTITINNVLYRVGVNYYAEYYSKGTWRTSASVTNNFILDKLNKIGRV